MCDRRKINRLPVLQCWPESNLTRRRFGSFVQTVTQSPDDPLDLHFAACRENNLHQYIAFDLLGPALIGINRFGLGENFHRLCIR